MNDPLKIIEKNRFFVKKMFGIPLEEIFFNVFSNDVQQGIESIEELMMFVD